MARKIWNGLQSVGLGAAVAGADTTVPLIGTLSTCSGALVGIRSVPMIGPGDVGWKRTSTVHVAPGPRVSRLQSAVRRKSLEPVCEIGPIASGRSPLLESTTRPAADSPPNGWGRNASESGA